MPDYKTCCFHCCTEIDPSGGDFCPECGKKHSVHYSQSYELPAGTYLKGNRYFVGESIGSGGFGITYIGYDFNFHRRVLIKETFYSGIFKRNCFDKTRFMPLDVEYGNNFSMAQIIRKTEKECMTLSEGKGLNNIVRVFDWFFENNTAYIITEYIEGITLEQHVQSYGAYPWQELYKKITPLMYNLSVLHSRGVIHRDIKPQNIMIRDSTQEFVLIDFGLARSLEANTLASVGISFSPGYSPFEQRAYTKVDNTFTDVYSLAATMYFAITGENPSPDIKESIDETFPLINSLPFDYDVPEYVVGAMRYALNINYNLRCSSIAEFAQRLSEPNTQKPHYLKASFTDNESILNSRTDEEAMRIRAEYQRRKQEQFEASAQRQNEIGDTLNDLVGKYRRKRPENEVGPLNFKKFIMPAIIVVIMIVILLLTK